MRQIIARPSGYYLRDYVLIFSFFIMIGSFRSLIVGIDYSTGEILEGYSALQFALLLPIFLFGLAGYLSRPREAFAICHQVWPIYVLPVLSVLSVVWSVDPMATFSKSIIFLLVYASGAGFLAAFGPKRIFACVEIAGAVTVVLSIIVALLFPDLGVHQITDANQNMQAGAWRGVFFHRTALGQFSAIMICLCIARAHALGFPKLRVLYCACAFICMIFANSTGSYISLIYGLITYFVFMQYVRHDHISRLFMLFTAICFGFIAFIIYTEQSDQFLRLIGKSANLSGRTEIWDRLWGGLGGHSLYGMGYYAGFQDLAQRYLGRWNTAPNAQNAYLDMMIAFGFVGCFVLAFALLRLQMLFDKAATQVKSGKMSGEPVAALCFAVALTVITLNMSMGESVFVEGNNFLTATFAFLVPAAIFWVNLARPSPPTIKSRAKIFNHSVPEFRL